MKGGEDCVQKDTRVLIVEDETLVSRIIQEAVKEIGGIIAGRAASGLRAVEMAQSLQPDVILMDIGLPDIDGLEAARRIQECCPTPVVVLTAHETPELVERAGAAGVGAYLVKPPQAGDMDRVITIAMARFGDMVELRRLNAELQARNAELQEALAKVKTLSGLLPICASCKKIRDDQGYWHQIEVYIRDHSEANFSHGICPDCKKKLYPGYNE
jgi:AmiR/NasT family two-component response regulator